MIGGYDNRRGATLMELVIAIGIAGIIGVVVYQIGIQGFETWRQTSVRAQSQEQARIGIDSMTSIIREIRSADNGAYPISSATASSFVFYANIDGDSSVEQVQFILNGTNLERRVIEPTGQPVVYTGSPTTRVIVPNVRSLAFDYFDKNYSGTQSSLTQPVTISSVRLVRISISVDDNVSKLPAAVTLSTLISMRNIKDNL